MAHDTSRLVGFVFFSICFTLAKYIFGFLTVHALARAHAHAKFNWKNSVNSNWNLRKSRLFEFECSDDAAARKVCQNVIAKNDRRKNTSKLSWGHASRFGSARWVSRTILFVCNWFGRWTDDVDSASSGIWMNEKWAPPSYMIAHAIFTAELCHTKYQTKLNICNEQCQLTWSIWAKQYGKRLHLHEQMNAVSRNDRMITFRNVLYALSGSNESEFPLRNNKYANTPEFIPWDGKCFHIIVGQSVGRQIIFCLNKNNRTHKKNRLISIRAISSCRQPMCGSYEYFAVRAMSCIHAFCIFLFCVGTRFKFSTFWIWP